MMIRFIDYFKILTEGVLHTIPSKSIGLSSKATDLPMQKPYGFWVDRSGNFALVRTRKHGPVARDIIENAIKYLQFTDKPIPNDYHQWSYETLYREGWIRVVLGNKTIMYETFPESNLTMYQTRFLEFVRDLYDMEQIVKDVVKG